MSIAEVIAIAAAAFFAGLSCVLALAVGVMSLWLYRSQRTVAELIDKFVHGRVPERIVEKVKAEAAPATLPDGYEGSHDPLSIAEFLAEKAAVEKAA